MIDLNLSTLFTFFTCGVTKWSFFFTPATKDATRDKTVQENMRQKQGWFVHIHLGRDSGGHISDWGEPTAPRP